MKALDPEQENKIKSLIDRLLDKSEEQPLRFGEKLAKIGGPQVREALLEVLKQGDMEDAFLATKVLSLMEEKEETLDTLLEVIHLPGNRNHNGGLVSLLEEFDLSDKFVDLLRIYLFGNFKASALAKEHLDYTEFVLSPRTLKKAEKHYKHFLNNPPSDGSFELKKEEAETILMDLRALFEEQ
jgi:hypothetical protein